MHVSPADCYLHNIHLAASQDISLSLSLQAALLIPASAIRPHTSARCRFGQDCWSRGQKSIWDNGLTGSLQRLRCGWIETERWKREEKEEGGVECTHKEWKCCQTLPREELHPRIVSFFFFTGKHHLPRSCQAALERLRISICSLFCNYFSCEVIR